MDLPTLSEPQRLWLLLLLPLVWLLALPPRPVRVLLTAHMQQWLLARETLNRSAPRVRPLRLLLLLAALTCCIVAHADPHSSGSTGADRLVVLLDTSASMAARGERGERVLDDALEALRSRLNTLDDSFDVRLLALGEHAAVLDGAMARAPGTSLRPAGALPGSLDAIARGATDERTAVWTITDGQPVDTGPIPSVGGLTLLGAPRDNWSLATVECVDGWPATRLVLRAGLVSHADRPARVRLTAKGAVAPNEPLEQELGPRQRTTVELVLDRVPAGGELVLHLEAEGDALALDDRWSASLPPLPAPRIGVLAEAGDAGRSARLAAQALAEELGGTVVESPAADVRVAFTVVEGGVSDVQPGRSRVASFGTRADGSGTPRVAAGVVLADWRREDPLLRGIDLSELSVRTALLDALPAGDILVTGQLPTGQAVPLAVAVRGAAATSVHFAFRLADSNLALLPAFPQILRRAMLTAHGEAARIRATDPVPAGESDLTRLPGAQERPMPPLRTPGRALAAWFLLGALALLALRAWVR
ncbi:MAG: hypothetical protein RL148_2714 [Planctomycetota bacterium]